MAEMVKDIDDELRNYFYVTLNGKIVRDWTTLKNDDNFHVHLRVFGGKGGFGSLLRSFRIHRSSNQLMCRDLSGRRLADVKEETKLKKWIAKAAEREAEKERKRKEKYERLKRGPPKHQFDDQDYLQLKDEILSTTDDAFEQGRQLMNKETEQASATTTSQVADAIDHSDTQINKAETDLQEQLICSSDSSNAVIVQQSVDVVHHRQQSTTTKMTKKQKKELEKEKKPIADEQSFAAVNLNDYESAFALEALGLDHLKYALEVRGLKCGGTLKERAERLFSVRGLSSDQYPKSILAATKKKNE